MKWRVVDEVAKTSDGVDVGAVGEATRRGSAGVGSEWMSKVVGATNRSPARPAIGGSAQAAGACAGGR